MIPIAIRPRHQEEESATGWEDAHGYRDHRFRTQAYQELFNQPKVFVLPPSRDHLDTSISSSSGFNRAVDQTTS